MARHIAMAAETQNHPVTRCVGTIALLSEPGMPTRLSMRLARRCEQVLNHNVGACVPQSPVRASSLRLSAPSGWLETR